MTINLFCEFVPENSISFLHTKAYLDFVSYIFLPCSNKKGKVFKGDKKKLRIHFHFVDISSSSLSLAGGLAGVVYVSNTTSNKSASKLDPVATSCICHATYHAQSGIPE